MLLQNACMKRKPKTSEQTRKPYKFVRVKQLFLGAAKAAAEELGHDLTQYVNDAIRMRLAADGKWPPPAKPAS